MPLELLKVFVTYAAVPLAQAAINAFKAKKAREEIERQEQERLTLQRELAIQKAFAARLEHERQAERTRLSQVEQVSSEWLAGDWKHAYDCPHQVCDHPPFTDRAKPKGYCCEDYRDTDRCSCPTALPCRCHAWQLMQLQASLTGTG